MNALTLTFTTAKKSTARYDLAKPSEYTKAKRFITIKISRGSIADLESLRDQLTAFNSKEHSVTTELARISAELAEREKSGSIIIKTKYQSYDINKLERHKLLKSAIKRYGKQKKFVEIKTLLKTVNKKLKDQPSHKRLCELQSLLQNLTGLEQEQEYIPYTTLLQQEFLPAKKTIKKIADFDADFTPSEYLEASVTAETETGQDDIDALSACFWLDFAKNTGFLAGEFDRHHVILYLVLVQGFFSHCASYYPEQGYGKSPKAECEDPLFYARSQAKHHAIAGYKKAQEDSVNYGKQNRAYLQMVKSCKALMNSDTQALAARVNVDGSLTERVSGQRLGEILAHLGSRASNATLFYGLLERAYDGSLLDDFERLKHYIPDKGKKRFFNKVRLGKRLLSLRESFNAFKMSDVLVLYPNIMGDIMASRYAAAQSIKTQCEVNTLENVAIDVPENSGFFYIRCYPNFTDTVRKESSNFNEGLTNVILGFFGALVNYYAMEAGLHYRLARRQSFGFLRASITDTGSLRLRVSLDADSNAFAGIYVQALTQLNILLKKFDFTNPESITDPNIKSTVKNCLKPCEDSKGRRVTQNTGDHLRAAMRCEDDQWIALLVGEKYLKRQEGSQDADAIATAAYKAYLDEFIYQRAKRKKVSDGEHKDIPRDGYSVANPAKVKLEIPSTDDPNNIVASHPILKLLNNMVVTTVAYIRSLPKLDVSESIYFILWKLLRNCQKGQAILNNTHRYEISHILAKAMGVVETIQEYLLPLKVLAKDVSTAKDDLINIDKARFAPLVEDSKDAIEIFYNDGGLQSINTGLLAMGFEGIKTVHLFNDCYYEIEKFCHENGIKTTKKPNADHWLCDITQISALNIALMAALNGSNPENAKPKAILIDITNNSTKAAIEKLKPLVETAQQNNIYVILSCSILKHEQLGQDKYQSGRNVIIKPPEKSLKSRTTLKHLNAISEEAMNDLFSACRQITETVSYRVEHAEALKAHGLFKRSKTQPMVQAKSHLRNSADTPPKLLI